MVGGFVRTLDHPEADSWLKALISSAEQCPNFVPGKATFARSLTLTSIDSGFILEKAPEGQWDNQDYSPGQRGNPQVPTKLASILELQMGFGHTTDGLPIFPTFETLVSKLNPVLSDVSFFKTDGKLEGEST